LDTRDDPRSINRLNLSDIAAGQANPHRNAFRFGFGSTIV
jgi:hypothetical protein